MDIEKNYKRRVRIIGKPTDLAGYEVEIQDAETGESISNVAQAVIVLRPTMMNVAILTIFQEDPNTHKLIETNRIRPSLVRANLPEIDITSHELILQEDTGEE